MLNDKIACKALYISDVHLGSLYSHAQDLSQFLEHFEPETFIVAGDLFDCWLMGGFDAYKTMKKDWQQTAIIKKLEKMSHQGVKIIFTAGNHDDLRDGNANELPFNGLKPKAEVSHETSDGRRLLILHGDIFDGGLYRNHWLNVLATRAYEAIEKLSLQIDKSRSHAGVDRAFRLLGLGKDWSLSRAVEKMYLEGPYKNSFKETALTYLFAKNAEILAKNNADNSKPEKFYDGIVCGHSHIPAEAQAFSPLDEAGNPIGPEKVTFLNTGCWTGPSLNRKEETASVDQSGESPSNTAIIEDIYGKMHHMMWVPEVGIVPIKPRPDGFFDRISRKEALSKLRRPKQLTSRPIQSSDGPVFLP